MEAVVEKEDEEECFDGKWFKENRLMSNSHFKTMFVAKSW
jgi:hypothetical protein